MRTVIAHSDEVETESALEDLLRQCDAGLAGETPRGAVLFMTSEYDGDLVLSRLQERWPGLPLIGSSTDGEVSSVLGYRGDSVCLTLFTGQGAEFVAAQGLAPSRDLEGALDEVLETLGERRPALCFVLCPGTTGNASDVIDGLHRRLAGRVCPIVGGLAGDHEVAPTTRQFFGSEFHHDSLVVLFICGDVKVSHGVASGWFPIGAPHTVTRSTGNKVHEIDDRPALEIYQGLWGERVTTNLGEFPLAVFCGGEDGDYFLRAAMACDEAEGSVTFAGDVPAGSTVRLTEVVPDGILSGTQTSIRNALACFPGARPEVGLLISCAARKWVLGTRAQEEIGELLEAFEDLSLPTIQLAGFYAFGEICPVEAGGPPRLHNETCVTLLLGE